MDVDPPQIKCFLPNCNSSDKVLPFNDANFKKCKSALEVRIVLKLKYNTQILTTVLKTPAKEIPLIFDQYYSPPIKDYERNQGGNDPNQRVYNKLGPHLTGSAIFQNELTNSSFKIALVQFLIEYWKTDECAPFFGNKTLYVNFDYCYVYK